MSFAHSSTSPPPQAVATTDLADLAPFLNAMKQEIASIKAQIDSKRSFEAPVNVLPTVEDLRRALSNAQDDLLAQRAEFFQQRLHDAFEFHAKLKGVKDASIL